MKTESQEADPPRIPKMLSRVSIFDTVVYILVNNLNLLRYSGEITCGIIVPRQPSEFFALPWQPA